MGSINLGGWGQALYIGLSILSVATLFLGIGAAVRAAFGVLKIGLRAAWRGIAALFSRATWSRIGSAISGWWSRHSIQIALGRGAISFSPIHAAWRVGGTALHAFGTKPLYWLSVPRRALAHLRAGEWRRVFQLQHVSPRDAASFMREAPLVFRLPALNPQLALKQGHGVWSCITSAWNAWSRANYHLPNIGLGAGAMYGAYRYVTGREAQPQQEQSDP